MGICQPKPKRDTDDIEGVVQPIRRVPGADYPKTSTADEPMPFKQAVEDKKIDEAIEREADHSEVAAEENPEDEPVNDKMRKSIVSLSLLSNFLAFETTCHRVEGRAVHTT